MSGYDGYLGADNYSLGFPPPARHGTVRTQRTVSTTGLDSTANSPIEARTDARAGAARASGAAFSVSPASSINDDQSPPQPPPVAPALTSAPVPIPGPAAPQPAQQQQQQNCGPTSGRDQTAVRQQKQACPQQPRTANQQQNWVWTQNLEDHILERTRRKHASDNSSTGAGVFDWSDSLEQEALARAREVSRQQGNGQGQEAASCPGRGQQALSVVHEEIPSASQALWQAYNPCEGQNHSRQNSRQANAAEEGVWRPSREQQRGAGVAPRPVTQLTQWPSAPYGDESRPPPPPKSPPKARTQEHRHRRHHRQGSRQETAGFPQRQQSLAPQSQPEPEPEQPQWPVDQEVDGQRRAPFMHYEDVTYFDPDHEPYQDPNHDHDHEHKDELLHSAGIREAETFDTLPDGTMRPRKQGRGKLSFPFWNRQRSGRQRKRSTAAAAQQSIPMPRKKTSKGDLGGLGVGVRHAASRGFCRSWLCELLWCLFAAVCVAAIAGVLYLYDGHAVSEWPLAISLNALVAFLATACRAGFVVPLVQGLAQLKWNWFARGERPLADMQLFENAARTPVGSARLLFSNRGRALGVLGTVLLLTGLASSGVTQIAIAYPNRLAVASSGTATVGVSNSYYYPNQNLADDNQLDVRQKQAIQAGLFQPVNATFPFLTPVCSSGDCSFQKFSSLAVCVAVADVSDRLSVSSQTNASALGVDLGPGNGVTLYNASLPNNVYLLGGDDSYNLNMSFSPLADDANNAPGNTFAPASASLAFGGQQNLVLSAIADIFGVYTNQTAQAGPGPASGFRAVEILMHFCVNSYTTAVTDGVATTTLTGSATDVVATTVNGTTIVLDDGSTTTAAGSAVLSATTGDSDSTNAAADGDGTAGSTLSAGSTAGNYSIDGNYLRVLNAYVESAFSGAYSSAYGSRAIGSSAASGALGTAMFRGQSQGGTTGTQPDTEVRSVIGSLMLNVATSLTDTIRSLGTAPISGTVLAPESYVAVQWPWLAFLAGQVCLTTAFLLCLMVQTAVWKVRVLKGSALASLVALSSNGRALLERQAGVGGVEAPAQMARKLDTVTGRFRPTDSGGAVLDLARKGVGG